MAQKGFGSTGEDGCQAPAMEGQVRMANCVDTWVESMQAAGIDGAVNRAPGVAERPG